MSAEWTGPRDLSTRYMHIYAMPFGLLDEVKTDSLLPWFPLLKHGDTMPMKSFSSNSDRVSSLDVSMELHSPLHTKRHLQCWRQQCHSFGTYYIHIEYPGNTTWVARLS